MTAIKGRKGFVAVPLLTRLMSRIEFTDNCWLWRGSRSHAGTGYGRIWVTGRQAPAHRVAYELLKGPIPEGLELDHLCRVKHCVNPAHLEPVTHRENSIRGGAGQHNAAKTHCIRGHALTPDNLHRADTQKKRECRQCRLLQQQERNRKIALAKLTEEVRT